MRTKRLVCLFFFLLLLFVVHIGTFFFAFVFRLLLLLLRRITLHVPAPSRPTRSFPTFLRFFAVQLFCFSGGALGASNVPSGEQGTAAATTTATTTATKKRQTLTYRTGTHYGARRRPADENGNVTPQAQM